MAPAAGMSTGRVCAADERSVGWFDVSPDREHRERVVATSWCPRCGADLVAPSVFDSAWRCGRHGPTLPLVEFHHLDAATMEHIRRQKEVPLWLPDPLPPGWLLAGLAAVGDGRSGFRATVTAFRGPGPLGGTGEWLIVAEEPGIGLGAGYAGGGDDSLQRAASGVPAAKITVRGHPRAIWPVLEAAPDRSAYVGEAAGVWLWLVGLPADAGYAVLENLAISDAGLRELPTVANADRSRWLRPGAGAPPVASASEPPSAEPGTGAPPAAGPAPPESDD